MFDQVANFARAKATAAIASGDTTISVTDASVFPDPSSPPAGLNGEFNLVLWDGDGEYPRPDQDPDVEIVRVTGVDTTNETLTVERGQEDTTATSHPDTAVAAQTYTRRLSQAAMARLMGASQSEFETLIEDAGVADKMATSLMAMGSVAASQTAMDAVAASQTAMDAVAASQTAMDAVAASQTAMDAVAASQTAMDEVVASQTAMDSVAASQTAMDAVAASQTAMDEVVASQTAMDTVVGSQTAMDAVAASQTARDTIGISGVGYDSIAQVAMAIGKYAAGIAGLTPTDYADIDAVTSSQTAMDSVTSSQTAMDSVAGSQTAMDSVAGSQTAMDSVSASIVARSTALESSYAADSIWSAQMPSEAIWNEGSIVQPDSDYFWELDFDLSNLSSMSVQTEYDAGAATLKIEVGGTVIFNNSNTHSWTERTFDISSYSGTTTVRLGWDTDGIDTVDNLIVGPTSNGRAFEVEYTEYDEYGHYGNLTFQ